MQVRMHDMSQLISMHVNCVLLTQFNKHLSLVSEWCRFVTTNTELQLC